VDSVRAAAAVSSALWGLWLRAQRDGKRMQHVPCAVEPRLLSHLSLPLDGRRPPDQPVAMLEGGNFERTLDQSTATGAYAARPRTRLFEGVDHIRGSWFESVASSLSRLTGFSVSAGLYQSVAHDAVLAPHTDAWQGLVLQLRGEKSWTFPRSTTEDVLLDAGHALYVPTDLQHAVRTPLTSVHVVFEVMSEER
jgi:hypothetical protein